MTMNPSVQEQAQADIDRVAPNRLPTLDDYDSLPYIRAIIKEVHRWGPVAPLGFFPIDIPLFSTWHLTSSKDCRIRQCKMMYMTTISSQKAPGLLRISGLSSRNFPANPFLHSTRAITHDEEIYPDPFTFNPSRHLGDHAQPDPYKFVFGFGKRACPGTFHFVQQKKEVNRIFQGRTWQKWPYFWMYRIYWPSSISQSKWMSMQLKSSRRWPGKRAPQRRSMTLIIEVL